MPIQPDVDRDDIAVPKQQDVVVSEAPDLSIVEAADLSILQVDGRHRRWQLLADRLQPLRRAVLAVIPVLVVAVGPGAKANRRRCDENSRNDHQHHDDDLGLARHALCTPSATGATGKAAPPLLQPTRYR